MRLLRARHDHDCEWRLRAVTLESELERLRTELSIQDPGTGLCNEIYFLRELGRALSRAKRTGAPFSVVLIDLHSSSVGGVVPMAMVHKVACQIAAFARSEDTVAEMDDGRLSVILAEAGERGAQEFSRRLSRMLAAEHWPTGDGAIFLGVRLGVAAWSAEVASVHAFLDQALADFSRFDEAIDAQRQRFGQAGS